MARPVRLAYVLGHGHSGSTLLGMLLGGHPRVFNLGEAAQIGSSSRVACGCRARPFSECSLWRNVEAEMRREAGLDFGTLRLDHPDPELFAKHNEAFLRASAAVTGASVLVDTSKVRNRLARLLSLESLDVRIISLRRDARGVVYSYVRKQRGAFRWSVDYSRTLLGNAWFLRGQPHLSLRYEDLVADPEPQLGQLFAHLEVGPRPVPLDLEGLSRHSIGGNRMRFERVEALRIDEAWREQWSLLGRAMVTTLTAPAVSLGWLIDPSDAAGVRVSEGRDRRRPGRVAKRRNHPRIRRRQR